MSCEEKQRWGHKNVVIEDCCRQHERLPRIAGLRHLALAALGILSSPCLQNTTFANRKTGRAGDPVTGLEENQKWRRYFGNVVTNPAH